MVRPPEAVLAPQVADLVVSEGKNKLLDTHRRYIVAQGVFEVAKPIRASSAPPDALANACSLALAASWLSATWSFRSRGRPRLHALCPARPGQG